ncbi:MAG: hypothetical protein OES13_11830, partial [Acidimicrobiia bacterium]|nr:hypothetical protein [Acidimicrobiia bacterium]
MSRRTWGHSLAALAMVAGVTFAVPQGIAAQPDREPERVDAWVQRVIYTSEFGVDRPTGLTVDPDSNLFYVIDSARNKLVGLTPFEDPADDIVDVSITDPLNVVLDTASRRVLTLSGGALKARPIGGGTSAVVARLDIADARGITADPATGDVYVLDGTNPRIFKIGASGVESRITIRELADTELRGIAYNPGNDRVYVASPTDQTLYEVDQSGDVLAIFDLAAAELEDPQALSFAASIDNTDDPAAMSLLIADGGGRIVEMSLEAQPLAVAAASTSNLV